VATTTLLKLALCAVTGVRVPMVNVAEKLPTELMLTVAYVPIGTFTTVLPVEGKLYGVAIPLKVAW